MNRNLESKIFKVSENNFDELALEIFQYQALNCPAYNSFLKLRNIKLENVTTLKGIPFLPIDFFKTSEVKISGAEPQTVFKSSGTGSVGRSLHHVVCKSIYNQSINKGFNIFNTEKKEFSILALLPSYLESGDSSLVYMVEELMRGFPKRKHGFFLDDFNELKSELILNEKKGISTLLVGVSYALLDFAEQFPLKLQNTYVMETGGMKGRRKEITRKNLHQILSKALGLETIYSEYGMTELLSQAYSKGNGEFINPPWMKVLIREMNDPFELALSGKRGGINIIDLANIYSCSFIETKDIGILSKTNTFQVLGRFENSDIRGCNLLYV